MVNPIKAVKAVKKVTTGKIKSGKKPGRRGIENGNTRTSAGSGLVSTVYTKGKNKNYKAEDYKAVMTALLGDKSKKNTKAIVKKEMKKDKPKATLRKSINETDDYKAPKVPTKKRGN